MWPPCNTSFHTFGLKFEVISHHKAVLSVMSTKTVQGFALKLQQYDFCITYRKGCYNRNAGGLSLSSFSCLFSLYCGLVMSELKLPSSDGSIRLPSCSHSLSFVRKGMHCSATPPTTQSSSKSIHIAPRSSNFAYNAITDLNIYLCFIRLQVKTYLWQIV